MSIKKGTKKVIDVKRYEQLIAAEKDLEAVIKTEASSKVCANSIFTSSENLNQTIAQSVTQQYIPRRLVSSKTVRLYNDGTTEVNEETNNTTR